MKRSSRKAPGTVRDAIIGILSDNPHGLPLNEIELEVNRLLGETPRSSIRSYLRLNTDTIFSREERGQYRLLSQADPLQRNIAFEPMKRVTRYGRSTLCLGDCFDWLESQDDNSIHAIVTDPPYGLFEYSEEQQAKLRNGNGGVWRIPPSFDGHTRSPLPRFTTLSDEQLVALRKYFVVWGRSIKRKIVPGANVIVASNPLVSYIVAGALAEAGLERRGEIIRLVMTMRGGDRPKDAHHEFEEVSVMPRSMWEPWLIFRKPLDGRVQDNLRVWKTGGFRRPEKDKPFGDVIQSAPTRKREREIAPHPSLKPQAFMRLLVRASLPLGEGTVVDPFAGAGSTLAAAEAVGYTSIGIEKDPKYFAVATKAIAKLSALHCD